VVIIIVIGTLALRKRSRRRLDQEAVDFTPSAGRFEDEEKPRDMPDRWQRFSDSSSGHGHSFGSDSSHGGHGIEPAYGAGSIRRENRYPTGPGFTQQGMPPQGQGPGDAFANNPPYPYHGSPAVPYPVPRSINPVYDPARPAMQQANSNPAFNRPVLPQLNVISATPTSNNRPFADAEKPIHPSGYTPAPTAPASAEHWQDARRVSLPAVSPLEGNGITRKPSSHSKELDPTLPKMPLSPLLPASFGPDTKSKDEDAYGGVTADDEDYINPRALKVANE